MSVAAQPGDGGACCWSAAISVIHGTLTLGAFFAVNGYLAAAGRAAADRSACGSASTSARSPPASGSSRCSTYERDIVERPDAEPLARGPGAHPLRGRRVRLRPRPAGAARHRPRRRGRADGRPDRPDRLRQDDADRADPAVLRRPGRAGSQLDGADVRDVTPATRCAAASGSSARTRSCSRRPSPRTSPTARPRRRRSRSCTAARQAQAHEFICDLPDGYETRRRRARPDRSRAASASGSRSPGRCSWTRAS